MPQLHLTAQRGNWWAPRGQQIRTAGLTGGLEPRAATTRCAINVRTVAWAAVVPADVLGKASRLKGQERNAEAEKGSAQAPGLEPGGNVTLLSVLGRTLFGQM
jgi:hypothetical protein